jgi:CheY-like chemotaxis protein
MTPRRGSLVCAGYLVRKGKLVARRILVVEDDAQLRALLGDLLSDEGYDIAFAGDGREALDVLATSPCDLVLSDVMMPRLDGRALARAMQADAALRPIPLVLISAGGASVVAGVDCAAFVPKPFAIDNLLQTVERILAAA